MEAFSLLKYWRSGGGGSGSGSGGGGAIDVSSKTTTTTTTTIATTVREMAAVVEEEEEEEANSTTDEDDGDDDEGPFFDLEFSVPDEEENGDDDEDSGDDNEEEEEEEEEEEGDELVGVGVGGGGTDGEEPGFNFTVSSSDSNGDDQKISDTNNNITFSPSDDLFFKGRLVPLEPSSSSIQLNQADKPPPPQFPVSLLKTATKFRVFMLGFKKTTKSETNGGCSTSPEPASNQKPETTQTQEQQQQQQQQQKQSKFFEVKFKVEEVPIISLFSRDNSSKNKIINKQQSSSLSASDEMNAAAAAAALEEKKFSKDVVQKYLKMIKPLYVKVSKRYGEKMGFSGQLSLGSGKTASAPIMKTEEKINCAKNEKNVAAAANYKSQKHGGNNLPGGFRVVRKHLGKSRSASSAVAAVTPVTSQAKRRDDSLLQQQDGIQSAILHCKRSFNASRDSDCCGDPLSRSTSNNSSSREKSVDASRVSFDEVIEARI